MGVPPPNTNLDESGLPIVRYYTKDDPVYADVDNRPLSDLAERDQVLQEEIDELAEAPAPEHGNECHSEDFATRAYVDGLGSLSVPVGTIIPYAADSPPAGFLECDGSEIPRETYANLLAIIGVSWGAGDGLTTFNLPDLRGEFLRGWDNGRGIDTARDFASFQDHQLQDHYHYSASSAWVTNGGNTTGGAGVGTAVDASKYVKSGNRGDETRPRNWSVMYAIKY